MLSPLIDYLAVNCHHPNIVAAILYVTLRSALELILTHQRVLKWHYSDLDPDDRGINETRAHACEIIAWRLLSHLSEREVLDYLLYELPNPKSSTRDTFDCSQTGSDGLHGPDALNGVDECTGLLSEPPSPDTARSTHQPRARFGLASGFDTYQQDPTAQFVGLNALEIAAVASAKKFLSQRRVQKIVHAIWCGDIIFWNSMNVQTKKKAQKYNKW